MEELEGAVEARLGVPPEEQRLYVPDQAAKVSSANSGVKKLELLCSGPRRLGDYGLFKGVFVEDRVFLYNAAYEAIRSQLAVATRVVDAILDEHYDSFQQSVVAVQRMADQFDKVRALAAEARAHVDGCRDALFKEDPAQADRRAEDAGRRLRGPKSQLVKLWATKLEAEAALEMLAQLRAKNAPFISDAASEGASAARRTSSSSGGKNLSRHAAQTRRRPLRRDSPAQSQQPPQQQPPRPRPSSERLSGSASDRRRSMPPSLKAGTRRPSSERLGVDDADLRLAFG